MYTDAIWCRSPVWSKCCTISWSHCKGEAGLRSSASRPSSQSQREGRSRNEISTCFNLYPSLSYLTRSCLFILICMSFVDVRSGLLPKFWEPNQLIEETNNGHQLQLPFCSCSDVRSFEPISACFSSAFYPSCIYHKHCPGREPLGWHMSSAMTWGRARL
jgi:hypothetical protein